MKVYDWIVLGLIISILIILVRRRVDGYTSEDMSKIAMNSFLIVTLTNNVPQGQVYADICDILLSQLGGNLDTALSKMNSLVTLTNTAVPSLQAPTFTTTDEFNQVFTTAFNSTESAFGNDPIGKRNKMILRTIGSFPIQTVEFMKNTFLPVSYTSDGKPTFTDEIVQASGKTVGEVLKYGVEVIKIVFAAPPDPNGPTVSADALNLINSIFPSNIPKFTSGQEFLMETRNTTNPTSRILFFAKAYIIGFAYIVWLAENKWRLDPAWSAGLVPTA